MTTISQTMKAWIYSKPGQVTNVLRLEPHYPTPPAPKQNEIMIRISYVSLNPGDAKMIIKPIPFRKSAIAGMDFVGEIVQLGPSPSPSSQNYLRVGSIVAGTVPMTSILYGAGSLAEYLVVPTHAVVEKPETLEEPAAAGLLGIVGQTGVTILRAAGLKKGDSVLVNGASGGVGCVLVQILRGKGVRVTGVCSGRNEALVRRLGADEVIDYTLHKNLYDHLTSSRYSFDAIIDCVGDDSLYFRSPGYLKVDGKYHSIDKGPFGFIAAFKFNYLPAFLGGRGVSRRRYESVFSNPAGSSAKEVVELFEKGDVKELPIDSIFGMDDVLQAFDKLATKRAVGKILVKVDGSR
ncbi:GroES-like protein [Poronia punctata]|nr:GroES-like protein [Poronia punctata]